ncbi:helix-turn-helix domain-containing protein [Acinetobacter baumannii]|nr:helix-turn-helix domain-containing protein [Acinetobacter baumannii]EKU2475725.1 helix-turn-helix domain-containing protein [Acinetobacter baumannii]
MAKYSQEFKLKVVEHYLSGHGDSVTGQLFNVHRSDVQKWSKAFKLYGLAGLERRRSKTTFTVEFKLILDSIVDNKSL